METEERTKTVITAARHLCEALVQIPKNPDPGDMETLQWSASQILAEIERLEALETGKGAG